MGGMVGMQFYSYTLQHCKKGVKVDTGTQVGADLKKNENARTVIKFDREALVGPDPDQIRAELS